MRVNDLRDRIVDLSHQSGADGEVRAKALGWLNAAYLELMNDLLALAPQALQRTESVITDAQGQAALATPPSALVRVLWGEVPLPIVSPLALLEADPLKVGMGDPALACATATGLQVQPRKAGSAVVVYTPQPLALNEDGAEETLLLPAQYHDALIWGGLVWSALFERGLASAAELNLFSRQWAEAKARVKLAMLTQAGAALRVQRGDA
jgi:hypothetical protein